MTNQDMSGSLMDVVSETSASGMKDYLASLRYAGMIQKSLLPPGDILSGLLENVFVTYMPRDYVSGDFYYIFRGKEFFSVAAGDCTGHGVPGALLSILNEILQTQTLPRANRVLNLMREKVMSALHQTGRSGESMDTIDLALCIFNYGSREMQFSGANRPLFIVRNGELREIKADKMSIGLAPVKEDPFTNNIVPFDNSDMFYLFSDGFPDQFGGMENKKFKYRQFRDLLVKISGLKASEQKNIVEETFRIWKGDNRQIDDVLVFGFKPKIGI